LPATYEIRGQLVHLKLEGGYTTQDVKRAMEEALDDPEFPNGALLLMDVTRSTSLGERSTEDLRDMAGYLARLSPHFGARLGIAAGSRLHYGMMRMAEVYSETGGMTARAFLTFDEASNWLLGELE